ncbi:uncharacterized protein N7511_011391 [Penicillium nucicola]|uniref:uncharacterized protein n=1 Tax=Penicillium nucicola TaxID=1850975 RepID=UPI0025456743|nr:uncharacterized protein N7511_011391 [Penicillium nucicola]KAJ5742372.1 hypothetical protein N7511_011391 [Penicillium nucicola]
MTSPEPYSQDTLKNSPLAEHGSDFPCKLRTNAFLAPSTETIYQIGTENSIKFKGSATHGGGSCQLSLTEDREPTKDSKWKVIKSYEGGCPTKAERLAGGATADNGLHLDFAIPEGVQPGKYTLAWTWFNRIGLREMYMNCAPITVASGSSQQPKDIQKQTPTFPPMFVANINGCITKENLDIRFPEPGSIVEHNGQMDHLLREGEPPCTGTPTFGASAAMQSSIPDPTKRVVEETDLSPNLSALARIPSSICSCHVLRRNCGHRYISRN